MSKIRTEGLTPMALGRLNKQLDTQYSFDEGVHTLRQHIESLSTIAKFETDGMINWNRRYFNRTSDPEGYEERLKKQRFYFINDLQVPKIVYDAVEASS